MKQLFGQRLLQIGGATLLLLGASQLEAQERMRQALPLDVAVSVRGHNYRSPINLSPDGEWLAHTVMSDETVPQDSVGHWHSATGFSFGEGDSRMEATVTNTKTGEVVRLGGARSASWGAVWSPDGRRVAFYSDEGGEAGVWVWERDTRTAKRFPGVIARNMFGFEQPRWSPDSERLLVKVLPEGRTIAQANAMMVIAGGGKQSFPKAGPGEPSVIVRRAGPKRDEAAAKSDSQIEAIPPFYTDLVLLDLRTQRVIRLVKETRVLYYAFSPDGKQVAYSVITGTRPNSMQQLYDLMVTDIAGGAPRRLAESIGLGYGIEWSWSPDGATIAFVESDRTAEKGIKLVTVADGKRRVLHSEGAPDFGFGHYGQGEYAPLWDPSGKYLYAVGDGELWRVDAQSGKGFALARIPGWKIYSPVQPFERPVIWTSDRGRTAWFMARDEAGSRSALFAVDLKSGKVRKGIEEAKTYSAIFNLAASEATGEIAFVSNDQQHMDDVWLFNIKQNRARQLTHLNPGMERYALGEARLIEWKAQDGKTLRAALLLPPGYREGERLPLVVDVYGGEDGSRNMNSFGLSSGLPQFNWHILATRGYAVLAPDLPVRTGHTMKDIHEGTMAAVDAAIAQGYADPERLALFGQSYGSFSVLSVITQTPRFKAAVITAVMHPDLFADYLDKLGYYEEGQGNMGGSIWEYPERYRENSPLFLFDRIQTPLLIGQGESDGHGMLHSEAIFTALERLGKTVENRVYQGEGHVLSQKRHVIDFWKRRLDFLAEHLGLEADASGRVTASTTSTSLAASTTPSGSPQTATAH